MRAAKAGAKRGDCGRRSAQALEQVAHNASLNGVGERIKPCVVTHFRCCASCAQRERFDVVVLDPPAFIKRRKDLKEVRWPTGA